MIIARNNVAGLVSVSYTYSLLFAQSSAKIPLIITVRNTFFQIKGRLPTECKQILPKLPPKPHAGRPQDFSQTRISQAIASEPLGLHTGFAGGLQKSSWLKYVAYSFFLVAQLHYKTSGNTQNAFLKLLCYGNKHCCCHKNLKQLQMRRNISVQMQVGGVAHGIYQARSGLNNSSMWKANKEAHLVTFPLVGRSLKRSKAREGRRGRQQPGMRQSQSGDQTNQLHCKNIRFAPDTQSHFLNFYDTTECISLIMLGK